jgi:hypothetical protein
MGKLFITLFAPQVGVSSLRSSTFAPALKIKFVMDVAPGQAHLSVIKILDLD